MRKYGVNNMALSEEKIKEVITLHSSHFNKYIEDGIQCEEDIAMLKVKTKELQVQREIVKKYFDQRMEERKVLFELANTVLDKAVKEGNNQIAQIAIQLIKVVNNGFRS